MRLLFTFLVLTFSHLCLAQTTLVISDVDDTLRLTHRKSNVWEQLLNVADPTMGFFGMPEILDAFDQENASIYYVSGTVSPISDFSAEFLDYNRYPQQNNFIHRGWFESIKVFKIRMIEEIIAKVRPDKIILIGDNGEFDSEVFSAVEKNHQNVSSYIHILYGADGATIPSSQAVFLTGADLALQLYLQGDLSAEQAEIAIDAVSRGLKQGDSFYHQFVIPPWADISTLDIERAFIFKKQWPEEFDALSYIESFLSKGARTSLRYFHLCQ